jgi:hypothetical protein
MHHFESSRRFVDWNGGKTEQLETGVEIHGSIAFLSRIQENNYG